MEPEPEPEPEPPETHNVVAFPAAGPASAPALRIEVDELTLDDVEKDPSGAGCCAGGLPRVGFMTPVAAVGDWSIAQYSGLVLWEAATVLARWMHRYAVPVGGLFGSEQVLPPPLPYCANHPWRGSPASGLYLDGRNCADPCA